MVSEEMKELMDKVTTLQQDKWRLEERVSVLQCFCVCVCVCVCVWMFLLVCVYMYVHVHTCMCSGRVL